MQVSKEIRREIGKQMSCYFKRNGISHKDVADRLNISVQTVHNHTHGATIGRKTRDAYFLAFGFEPEYLRTGKGKLIKTASGYQKIKQENDQLRAIIKAQRITIERLKSNIGNTALKV